MRKRFGSLCESATPREYIDAEASPAEALEQVGVAMSTGADAMIGAVCRTARGAKAASLLCFKGLRAQKSDAKPAYMYVDVDSSTCTVYVLHILLYISR